MCKKLVNNNDNQKLVNNNATQIFNWIKDVILKYCPDENRFDLLDIGSIMPEFTIQINLDDIESSISFMFGNSTFQMSIQERARISGQISSVVINNLIDFLIADHKAILAFDLIRDKIYRNKDTNELQIVFAINWCNEALEGLKVGNIYLNINFGENIELAKKYIYMLFNNYKDKLEKTSFYEKIINDYIDNCKANSFESLSEEEKIKFISYMDEEELSDMLMSMDPNVFMNTAKKYFENYNGDWQRKLHD